MARRCLNTEAQRHRARSCTVPDASRVAGAGKVRLGDVCSFSKGQQINGKELSDSYDYPFINGGVSPSGNWKDYNVEKGAITISEGGNSCGFVNYFEVPFWCGAHCYYFYELKLEPKYFYYALKANEERLMGLRSGICMPNIRKGDLDEFEFCIDWDKATQQRIADELDRLCALKKNAEDRLAILDQIVKSRFVEMFGDPVVNPKGWDKRKISDFAEVRIGPFGSLLHKDDYVTGGHPLVNPSHMKDGRVDADDDLTLTDEKYEELKAYHLKVGDVVVARRGEIGRCALVEREGLLCGTGSMFVRVGDSCRADYLQRVISFPTYTALLENGAVGVTMKNINASMVEDALIPLPPMSAQGSFSAFVAEIDKSELTLRETVATLDQLYRAKLQEYFG